MSMKLVFLYELEGEIMTRLKGVHIGEYFLRNNDYYQYGRYKKIEKALSFCEYLDRHGVHFDRCIKHQIVSGCNDSTLYYERFQAYLFDEYVICKNLFVQERKGNKRKFLIITDSRKRVDLTSLKEVIDSKKLEFVHEDTMKDLLHTTPGNVSIFNIVYDSDKRIELIIDEDLLRANELSFHPLYNEMSIFLKPAECLKFLKLIDREATILPIKDLVENKCQKVIAN